MTLLLPPAPSNSVQRSQPVLPISKIDERLEHYTQAVEVHTASPLPRLSPLCSSCSPRTPHPQTRHPPFTHTPPALCWEQQRGGRARLMLPHRWAPQNRVLRKCSGWRSAPTRNALCCPMWGMQCRGGRGTTAVVACWGLSRGPLMGPSKWPWALSPLQTAGRAPKLTRQPSIELPSMTVASTKSRWETGEVQAQSAVKGPSCKVGPSWARRGS